MLSIYNTAIRAETEFKPLDSSVNSCGSMVGMYVCGPTVQSSPHIGHMRVAVAFDVIRRYFLALGYTVNFVQNVTDINDTIFERARVEGISWQDLAKKYEQEFFDSYDALNVLKPSHKPHATEYIAKQITLIQKIMDNGYAYKGAPGDVWFDTAAFKDYGALTNQTDSADLEVSDEDLRADKRNPRDFALWKAPKENEDVSFRDAIWDSPWGSGRPGWHIECSAMATDLLGAKFDIHGGGLDLRFPHHENEVAQARAAGMDFANIWMHSAWVTAKGEKMSKSLGNGLSVSEVISGSKFDAFALRYALSTVNYRTMLEWTPETLTSAKTAIKRLHTVLCSIGGEKYTDDLVESIDINLFPEFTKAMDNDFATSEAMAQIYIALKNNRPVLHIRKALQILGIDPLSEAWRSAFDEKTAPTNSLSDERTAEIEALIAERAEAKSSKNFARADEIRKNLKNDGIELEDTPSGTKYFLV